MRTEIGKQMNSILTKVQKISKRLPKIEGEEDTEEEDKQVEEEIGQLVADIEDDQASEDIEY